MTFNISTWMGQPSEVVWGINSSWADVHMTCSTLHSPPLSIKSTLLICQSMDHQNLFFSPIPKVASTCRPQGHVCFLHRFQYSLLTDQGMVKMGEMMKSQLETKLVSKVMLQLQLLRLFCADRRPQREPICCLSTSVCSHVCFSTPSLAFWESLGWFFSLKSVEGVKGHNQEGLGLSLFFYIEHRKDHVGMFKVQADGFCTRLDFLWESKQEGVADVKVGGGKTVD